MKKTLICDSVKSDDFKSNVNNDQWIDINDKRPTVNNTYKVKMSNTSGQTIVMEGTCMWIDGKFTQIPYPNVFVTHWKEV